MIETLSLNKGIMSLRPHHVDRLVNYYKNRKLFNNHEISRRYGEEFKEKYQKIFDFILSGGTGEEAIVVRNQLDTICYFCPIQKESCSDPDSLSIWNGSGLIMDRLNLEEDFLYLITDFKNRVEKL